MRTIYLEIDEEITEVIDRLKKAEEDEIAFVIPRNSTLAQSVVNLKLLSRAAKNSNKEIIVVSADSVTRNLADQVGLDTFSRLDDLKTKEAIPSSKGSAKLAGANHGISVHNYQDSREAEVQVISGEDSPDEKDNYSDEEDNYSEEEPEESKNDEISNEKYSLHKKLPKELRSGGGIMKKSRKAAIWVYSAIAVIAAVLWFVYLPKAEILVIMKTDDYDQKFSVTIDKNASELNKENSVLPGVIVDYEKSLTRNYPSTGKKNVGDKAKGTLTFYNSATTADQQLSAGVEVSSSSGVKFMLDKNIVIPKGSASVDINGKVSISPGSIQSSVTAIDGGTSSNFGDGTIFSIVGKPSTISAKGSTSGGADREVLTVSAEDIEKASIALKETMLNEGKAELLEKSDRTEVKGIEDSISFELTSIQYSKNEGDESDTFDAIGTGKLTILGFTEQNLYDFVISLASDDLGLNKTIINPSAAEIKYAVTSKDTSAGVLKLDVDFKGKSGRKISESDILTLVVAKKKSTAKSNITGIEGVQSNEIQVRPNLLPLLPLRSQNIVVKFDYIK